MISVTNLSLAVLLLMQISSSHCQGNKFSLENLQTDEGLCTLISTAIDETSKNVKNVETLYNNVSNFFADNVEGGEAMKKMNFGSFKAKVKQFEAAVVNAFKQKKSPIVKSSKESEQSVNEFLQLVYGTNDKSNVDNNAPEGLLEFMNELAANEKFNTIGENLLAEMIREKEKAVARPYKQMLTTENYNERIQSCTKYMGYTKTIDYHFTDKVVESIVDVLAK